MVRCPKHEEGVLKWSPVTMCPTTVWGLSGFQKTNSNSKWQLFLFPPQLTNAIKAGIIMKSNFYKFGPGWIIRDRSDHILKSRLVRKLLIPPLVNSWTCLNDTWRLGVRFAHQEEESLGHFGCQKDISHFGTCLVWAQRKLMGSLFIGMMNLLCAG